MSEELKNKILWIEDEEDILEIGKDVLEEEGYAVTTAGDGVEGLKKIFETRPDLIILDMNMPKMSGMEVYQKIYNTEKKKTLFPVMALTARAELRELFLERNVTSFMSKPFEMQELIIEVHLIFKKIYGHRAYPKAEEKAAAVAQVPIRETTLAKAVHKTRRVLLVDESPVLFSQVITYFSNFGYDVIHKNCATDAIGSLLKYSADAVLINQKLPDLSGDNLIRKIKQMPRTMDVPVILFSHDACDQSFLFQLGQDTGYEIPFFANDIAGILSECHRLMKEVQKSRMESETHDNG